MLLISCVASKSPLLSPSLPAVELPDTAFSVSPAAPPEPRPCAVVLALPVLPPAELIAGVARWPPCARVRVLGPAGGLDSPTRTVSEATKGLRVTGGGTGNRWAVWTGSDDADVLLGAGTTGGLTCRVAPLPDVAGRLDVSA